MHRCVYQSAVTAHSGCEGTQRDSLESVMKGIALGADFIEVDVREMAGELVIAHDKPDGASYAGLTDALRLIAQSESGVNCDIKEPSLVVPAIALAERMGLGRDRIVLSGSVRPALLREDTHIAKRAKIFLNIEEALKDIFLEQYPNRVVDGIDLDSCPPWEAIRLLTDDLRPYAQTLCDMCGTLGAAALNLPVTELTRPILPHLREFKLPLSLWTIDDEEAIKELMRMRVHNVTTRYVCAALRIRAEIQTG